MPDVIHSTEQYENNRAEQSHEPTRVRERGMRRFKSVRQAQRFVTSHAAVSNLFNMGRHLIRAEHYRNLRVTAFAEWSRSGLSGGTHSFDSSEVKLPIPKDEVFVGICPCDITGK